MSYSLETVNVCYRKLHLLKLVIEICYLTLWFAAEKINNIIKHLLCLLLSMNFNLRQKTTTRVVTPHIIQCSRVGKVLELQPRFMADQAQTNWFMSALQFASSVGWG